MIVEMARAAADAEKASAHDLLTRARLAMAAVDHYDQERVDRLCRAVAWATRTSGPSAGSPA
jgi:hypothetical protein